MIDKATVYEIEVKIENRYDFETFMDTSAVANLMIFSLTEDSTYELKQCPDWVEVKGHIIKRPFAYMFQTNRDISFNMFDRIVDILNSDRCENYVVNIYRRELL